jgi:uncharacterized protein (DUF1800 family)
MVTFSSRERVAHVVRRLSMGVHPELVARLRDPGEAIDAALDLSAAAATPLAFDPPADFEEGRRIAAIARPIGWWLERMASGERLVEERLVWFWHDHFATSVAKVRVPYLMWQQHLTLRAHATRNYGDLLKAVSRDPAMLLYLDGITNAASERNENFGRECLELFTMGRDGGYTQNDVVEASRAFTGWVVNIPGRRFARRLRGDPWSAVFLPQRHDVGSKTLLGTSGAFDLDGAIDVILDHPSTARFVSAKLYRELVGLEPSRPVVDRLAARFRRDYEIMPLVTEIAHDDAFVSDSAVRAKYRTPVEKLVGILQATGTEVASLGRGTGRRGGGSSVGNALRTMSFLPFVPPNVGGYPKGARLVGPHNLVHTFDLLQAVVAPPARRESIDDLFARFGLHDVTERSRATVQRVSDPATRLALVATSPEFTLT